MRDGGTQRNSEVMDDSPCTLADQADRGNFQSEYWKQDLEKSNKILPSEKIELVCL